MPLFDEKTPTGKIRALALYDDRRGLHMFAIILFLILAGIIGLLELLCIHATAKRKSLSAEEYRAWFSRVYFGITVEPVKQENIPHNPKKKS